MWGLPSPCKPQAARKTRIVSKLFALRMSLPQHNMRRPGPCGQEGYPSPPHGLPRSGICVYKVKCTRETTWLPSPIFPCFPMAQVYCPATLYAGGCDSPNCTLRHNAKFCSICAVVCSPPQVYAAHERGRQHQTNLATHNTSSLLLCSICGVIVSGQNNWSPHIAGAAHCQKARNAGISPSIYPRDPSVPNSVRCVVCQKSIPDANWPAHLLSAAHIRQQNASFLRARFERAQQDRRGVLVSHADTATIDFGVISRAQAQQGLYTDVTVSASSPSSSVSLFRAECFGSGTAATSL